jgi:hypothetical protein
MNRDIAKQFLISQRANLRAASVNPDQHPVKLFLIGNHLEWVA